MLIRLLSIEDGDPVWVSARIISMVSRAYQETKGCGKSTPVIGAVALTLLTGGLMVVKGNVETIAGQINKALGEENYNLDDEDNLGS